MSVRAKLFSAMVALILFMTGVFFAISHGYMQHLFQEYAVAAREGEAEQWAAMLSYYYEKNGNSWNNVDQYVAEINDQKLSTGHVAGLERLVILDKKQHLVFVSRQSRMTSDEIINHGIQVPITENGQDVGTLSVMDRDLQRQYHLESRILASMTTATIIGAILTMVAALLIGLWLTRRLTRPLQLLMSAIERISHGDLRSHLPAQTKDEFGQVAVLFNQMAEQLAKVERIRRHLVADVAHELRTPITIIQGQLELIQQGVRRPDPATLLPIQDEVMRLGRLVQDLHQLSLAEAGILPLEKTVTDVRQLAERIVSNFELEAEEKSIRLSVDGDRDVEALVDANRLTQVFVNLIGNALRYTEANGKVTVFVWRETEGVKIVIQDTGRGIDDEHLPYIFDRFYRAEQARDRTSGGMGLGLAIAKEFVEAHKGRIEVASKPQNGTIFTVFLPAK